MKPDESIVVPEPPPMGTTLTPPLVETSTIVPAVSADQMFCALVTRSARVQPGELKELMVADGPAPGATSQ
jgi:hypothetical protein